VWQVKLVLLAQWVRLVLQELQEPRAQRVKLVPLAQWARLAQQEQLAPLAL
jgi:hypothetical protein